MKSFFKYLLATIVGVFIASFLGFLIMLGIFGAMVSSADKPVEVKDNSILYLTFDETIVDRAVDNPFSNLNFGPFASAKQLGLNDILKAIENAKEDPKIKGIYIQAVSVAAGGATVEEIRDALIDFKESGKFIISYSDIYSQKAYYLASVSDNIYMNPEGGMEWMGLRGEVMFYKNALEKLGIEPQIIRHGKFKSAVEPFMLDKMSDANREQMLTFMGSIWNHWVKGVSESRNISVEELNRYADEMLISNAKRSVEYGLIDSLIYKDELIDKLKKLTETKDKDDLTTITLAKYIKAPSPIKKKGLAKNKIAVVYAQGEINMGEGQDGTIGSETISKAIREARRDSSIKAIVFRVNSPGGSALASEVIWREVVLAKQTKPVIISMGDLAASGGYYIAAPGDVILASPTTLTGSIGVFGMYFSVKEGMNKKLGLTVDVVKTNKYSDFGSMYRPLTAEERAISQQGVEDIYQTFIGHVAEGRGITKDEVDAIGQGRVWSGANAMDIKLVDEFGGLKRAIAIAAEKAGVEEYRVVDLPKQKDPFQALMEDLSGNAKMMILGDEFVYIYKQYQQVTNMVKNQGVQARMPFEVEMY
ncbi:MAG TPA: signal peptide peptidase SppA [Tenuifilaceae bacterium]|nr:signal peptide peptidase SppA [Tenuifilaceae bacterium]HQB77310.1 signal peptide peptidase SppA [Tenuifilaceae bacterium]